MISEIEKLLEDYRAWLKDRTSLRQVGDWVEISTPYLDRHNDYLQIYAKREDGAYLLTDDGYILEDLISSGCTLESHRRKTLLNITLNGFGVQREGNALQVHATASNFSLRKHNLIQAMLAVNDLFFLAAPIVVSVFLEDVTAWLELHEIRFTPKVKFTGKSGYDHLFDFVIPKTRVQPERILKTINRPNRDYAQALIYSWIDIQEVRLADARAYAIINDADHLPLAPVVDALKSYDVQAVLWSEREKARHELAN